MSEPTQAPESLPEIPPDDFFEEGPPDVRARVEEGDVWRERLLTGTTKKGDIVTLPNSANVATILRYHPAWRDVIATDAFAEAIVTRKPAPWNAADAPANHHAGEWADADTARLVNWLAREERVEVGVQCVEMALSVVADTCVIHPVRDYLAKVKAQWDCKQRLPSLLSTYFGAKDSDYVQGVGARWMISAVARIMRPGTQVDVALILEGPQGIGKTSAFRALVPEPAWYADTGIDIGNKDSYQALRSVWIYGLDELDSLRRGELTRTKNFLSATADHYRPTYARRAKTFQRQCVFAGTTNEKEYLNDRTGNRRFWPVRILSAIDVEAIRRDRDQLWAEAMVRYESGEKHHVDTPEFRKLCEIEQGERLQADPWEPVVSAWLARPIERGEHPKPIDVSRGILTIDVLTHAIGMRTADVTKADEMRVADILRSLGYERGPQRHETHGRVRRFVRPSPHTNLFPEVVP